MVASASNTVYGIINDAMHDAGLLQEGSDPNSEQLATYMRRLCDVINLWQTQGLKLFLQDEITIPLVAGQTTYPVNPPASDFPTKHLRVLQGAIVTPDGQRRPLSPLSRHEWFNLSQTSGTYGSVNSFYVDKQATSLNVHFWSVPGAYEANNSALLVVQKQAANPINLESNVAFPQEWRIALRWGLADDICTGQPQAIMDRCAQRAITYREMLEDWDVEDVQTTFAPANGHGYYGKSFL